MKTYPLLFMLACLGLTTQSYAQLKKAEVAQLAFMAGTWTQKQDWGDMEEFWGKPMGDGMISSFRVVKSGKVIFYEFVVIEQTQGLPVLKMRHFNRGSIGWEEKDKPLLFPLIQLEKNTAVFELTDKTVKLTYKRISTDKMDVILDEKDKKGVWKREVFNYKLLK